MMMVSLQASGLDDGGYALDVIEAHQVEEALVHLAHGFQYRCLCFVIEIAL